MGYALGLVVVAAVFGIQYLILKDQGYWDDDWGDDT